MKIQSQSVYRNIIKNGFLGGIAAFYFSIIGMIETFSQRNLVGNKLSLGHVLLFSGFFLAGFLTTRGTSSTKRSEIIRNGVFAGLVSTIPLILLNFFINVSVIQIVSENSIFKIRDMFVNFSPNLVDLLTFKQGLILGNILLAAVAMFFGFFGAWITVIEKRLKQAIIGGILWTLGFGLFSENISQILQGIFGRGIVKFLFAYKALRPTPALIVFAVAFGIAYLGFKNKAQTRWNSLPGTTKVRGRKLGIILGIVALLLLPWVAGLFLSQAIFLIGLYVMMGLGLNIVVGYAGLLDLGYVAFFAFGAYSMGVLTTTSKLGISQFNFWTAIPFCVLAGVLWGVLLGFPVLRMRGDYLAIVTLGFGEIIRILALSDWLAPIEGGAQGVLHIPNPSIFGFVMSSPQSMYYLVIVGSVLAAFVTIRLRDSRLGRQWMAMREDEDVAEAMGINLVQSKLLAFAIGAAFSALAGAIFASRLGNIFPHSFNLLWSINALSLIIVGGLGSIPGVVVGAIILVGLPEILREFAEYRLLIYGLLLIIMMLVKPEGFIPESSRQRELRIADEDSILTVESPKDRA